MLRKASVALAAAAIALAVSSASAQQARVGVLECSGGQTTGFIVGSVSSFNCVFRPSGGGARQAYTATIRRVGVDLGVTERAVLAWAVFASNRQLGLGDLSGNYAGVQASASVGGGAGANVLIGGSNNSISLQPLSVQGQTGLNVAGGVASLELRFGR
jgi:hypothetical protein